MPFVLNFPFFSIFLAILCGVVCLLLGARAAMRLSFFCLTALTLMSAAVLYYTARTGGSYAYVMGQFPAPFGNELRAGALEASFALLLSFVSLFSLAGGLSDIAVDLPGDKIPFYFLMQNLMTAAMLAIVYANDLFTSYIFVEILMISACSLITAKKGGLALTSAMTYLIMSLAGSCLLLLSIAILYSVTGHLLMSGLRAGVAALAASGRYALPLFMLSGLMAAALAIKSALFPFHSWLPEAHTNATTAASAVLSGLVVKCSLFLLIKVQYRIFSLETSGRLGLPLLLLIFGSSGIFYGSLKAIRQNNIKRMLSFASVVQVGYVCCAMSINTAGGMAAACFHIMVHATVKAMLFTAAGGLAEASGYRKDFDSLRGAAWRAPLSGAAFLLGGLAMVGIPPLPGFASKLYVALASLESPYAVPVVIAAVVLSTIMSAMYYYPAIACVLSRSGADGQPPREGAPSSPARRVSLVAFMAATLFLGIFSRQIILVIEEGLAVFG